MASQVALVIKKLPASTGDVRDEGSVPELGTSPGGGHGYPLKYPYLENPMDRRDWWATFHGVTKSQTCRHTLCNIIYLPFKPKTTKNAP